MTTSDGTFAQVNTILRALATALKTNGVLGTNAEEQAKVRVAAHLAMTPAGWLHAANRSLAPASAVPHLSPYLFPWGTPAPGRPVAVVHEHRGEQEQCS